MGYEQELISRAELQFSSRVQQLAWLSSFDNPEKGANDYTRAAVAVRDELLRSEAIVQQSSGANTLRELKKLDDSALSLEFGQEDAIIAVQLKTSVLEGEADNLANVIKSSRNFNEMEGAIEELRVLAPRKLGGIRSGQTRFVGSKKEQKLISEAVGSLF